MLSNVFTTREGTGRNSATAAWSAVGFHSGFKMRQTTVDAKIVRNSEELFDKGLFPMIVKTNDITHNYNAFHCLDN